MPAVNTQTADITAGQSPFDDGSRIKLLIPTPIYISSKIIITPQTYIAAVTFRADATSQYNIFHRWGYFPSVGLAWIASEEKFFEPLKSKVDFLKLKTSWGKFGNDTKYDVP